MCGFTGFISYHNTMSNESMMKVTQSMASRIQHRGPDDTGVLVDDREGVALGHRRLSIIDLSEEGHQPMTSSSDRYVLVF